MGFGLSPNLCCACFSPVSIGKGETCELSVSKYHTAKFIIHSFSAINTFTAQILEESLYFLSWCVPSFERNLKNSSYSGCTKMGKIAFAETDVGESWSTVKREQHKASKVLHFIVDPLIGLLQKTIYSKKATLEPLFWSLTFS